MPVFRCTTCKRYLFRPAELLGRAWQCPSCGPTVVADQAVEVSSTLADLLEREYRLSFAAPPPVSRCQCRTCGRPPYRPDDLLGHAWQCPACGPTVVADAIPGTAVVVSEQALRKVARPPFRSSALALVLYAALVLAAVHMVVSFRPTLRVFGAFAGVTVVVTLLVLFGGDLRNYFRRKKYPGLNASWKERAASMSDWPPPPQPPPGTEQHVQPRTDAVSDQPNPPETNPFSKPDADET